MWFRIQAVAPFRRYQTEADMYIQSLLDYVSMSFQLHNVYHEYAPTVSLRCDNLDSSACRSKRERR